MWVIESFAGCLPFDLLWLDGEDLRGLPLLERKTRLERLISGGDDPRLLYVEHVPADHGQALYDAAIAAGCEGIVSKRVIPAIAQATRAHG